MIEPVTFGLEVPQGHATVDLIDDYSGRVIQREEGDNFLTVAGLNYAKWWQKHMWGRLNPVQTLDANGYGPMLSPVFPAEHLAYWNDAAAEVPASEHTVQKPLVGFASRQPVGTPIGLRGVVSTTESAFSDTEAKWVFEWTTSCGNGTFQSVGWCRVHEAPGYPMISVFPDPSFITFNVSAASTAQFPGIWWDGTNWLAYECLTYPNLRIMSYPAAGGAGTLVCTVPGTIQESSYTMSGGLARIGTDFIVCGGYTGGQQGRIGRLTAAGTQVWVVTESVVTGTGITWRDCTIDGSGNIWVATGADAKLRRINPSTGALDGTLLGPWTTPTGIAMTEIVGCAYDPADSGFWVSAYDSSRGSVYVFKINSSGTITGIIGSALANNTTISSTTPYAGTYTQPATRGRDGYTFYWHGTGGGDVPLQMGSVTSVVNFPWSFTRLVTNGTEPWIPSFTNNGAKWAIPLRGRNLASRVKLGAPVTKTSSQSLKITYTMTFS